MNEHNTVASSVLITSISETQTSLTRRFLEVCDCTLLVCKWLGVYLCMRESPSTTPAVVDKYNVVIVHKGICWKCMQLFFGFFHVALKQSISWHWTSRSMHAFSLPAKCYVARHWSVFPSVVVHLLQKLFHSRVTNFVLFSLPNKSDLAFFKINCKGFVKYLNTRLSLR